MQTIQGQDCRIGINEKLMTMTIIPQKGAVIGGTVDFGILDDGSMTFQTEDGPVIFKTHSDMATPLDNALRLSLMFEDMNNAFRIRVGYTHYSGWVAWSSGMVTVTFGTTGSTLTATLSKNAAGELLAALEKVRAHVQSYLS